MHPPIRTQHDGEQEIYSLETGLDCSNLPDMARQEFKREADINYILSRFGVGELPYRQVSYGEVDFDVDLHSGFIAAEAAQLAWARLPQELRAKYKNAAGMLDAANSGEFGKDLKAYQAAQEAAKEAAKAAEAPSTPPAP